MQILIIVVIILWMTGSAWLGKNKTSAMPKKRNASAVPNTARKRQASAVPNIPKRLQRTREEAVMEMRTRASARECHYDAAYSKGKPKYIGGRGDYEPSTPQGMIRFRCAYCGAENFIPSGTKEHYHCYFCWEKL